MEQPKIEYWSYRIGKKTWDTPMGPYSSYGIIEVYCDKDDEIVLESDFMEPRGDTKEELIEDLERMFKAAKEKPIVEMKDETTDSERSSP